jgi:acetylornithine deacetylase/succinyl-diaminopimelate desuccinylase-like protein
MASGLESVLALLDQEEEAAVARLCDFLRIPSISADPSHKPDCVRAADWAATRLRGMGFAAQTHATPGHPVVLGHFPGPRSARPLPRILYYGHYDVQPADPLELWHSPPFEPRVIDGPNGKRLVARGAVDDKGQSCMILDALSAWSRAGGIPLPVTVLLEGEEEVGSTNLDAFLAAHQDALGADIVVISDTNMWDVRTPAISTRVRGLAYAQLTIQGPNRDLHSGMYGGSAINPINVITAILGQVTDAEGHVRIPGFYDNVAEIAAAQAAQWQQLGFDEAAFLGKVGLTAHGGEQGRSGLERLWARPTADINGIWGGYTGPGAKTVIAAAAHAKISFRLVPGQDPAAIMDGFEHFVRERLPAGVGATVERFSAAPGIDVPSHSPFVQAASAILAEEYGRAPALVGCGGSIPVVESFRRILGLDTLLMGFGLDDDQIHSPNEKFDLVCFHHGARAHARLLARLAA